MKITIKHRDPYSPFPESPIGAGGMMLLVISMLVMAVITKFMALIAGVGLLVAIVIGVRSWLRLREGADTARELKLLTRVSFGLCMMLIGVVGLGFAFAARNNPERRRELISRGWIGQLVALGGFVAVGAVIGLLT